MAAFTCTLRCGIDEALRALEDAVLGGSVSATREAAEELVSGGCRCAVRVYERYSALGGNRVSLSLTLLGGGPCTELCAVASGGSQALFFKINTFGEEAFLDSVRAAAERFC